jgi:DNA repair photolyase
MFPSAHDITPDHLAESLIVIKKLLKARTKVLIVTKPHYECIKKICEKYKKYTDKILFRFTIGSSDSDILKYWEPGAPSFEERLKCLKYAYKSGFQTSVSCEPMLDNNIGIVIKKVLPYVTDAIWLGKANFLLGRLKINKCNDKQTIRKALKIIACQTDKNIKNLYKK